MSLSRRSFLKGVASFAALVGIPVAAVKASPAMGPVLLPVFGEPYPVRYFHVISYQFQVRYEAVDRSHYDGTIRFLEGNEIKFTCRSVSFRALSQLPRRRVLLSEVPYLIRDPDSAVIEDEHLSWPILRYVPKDRAIPARLGSHVFYFDRELIFS